MEGCECTHCVCGEKVIYKVPENQNWIQIGEFSLHSGETSILKFELDKFTQSDWEAVAFLAARKYKFREVIGIPTGGQRLADAMSKYATGNSYDPIAIVDDVFTSGGSMKQAKSAYGADDCIGIVAVSRGKLFPWVDAFLQMNEGWDT